MIKPKAYGTQADLDSKVDIGKVFGGYFSSLQNAKQFIEVGLSPIINHLPSALTYADFGGGQGFLAKEVDEHFVSQGKQATTIVVDANSDFLKRAHQRGLSTILYNLTDDIPLCGVDLITMRAVNHYNSPSQQLEILRNTHRCLKSGGYLVSQISTGSEGNCRLRSAIANLPSLGRATGEGYHWTTETEYASLLKDAGFSNIAHAGYAPPCAWTPEDQWERFNSVKITEAKNRGDAQALKALELRKSNFLKEANTLIQNYLISDPAAQKDIEQRPDGSFAVHYSYAIIVAKK